MFHRATLKLTGLYLGIIMLISLAFSVSLYQLSVRELDRGLRRQGETIINGPQFRFFNGDSSQITVSRQIELDDSKERIVLNLLVINIGILVSGGFLSYYLARRTLTPIEEAHKAQSRFTADASHELRTPLAAMQTEIEVALMDPALNLSDAKQQLTSNLEELAKLTNLSDSLLRLARLEDNHLEKVDLDVNELILTAIDRVNNTANKKGVTIKYNQTEALIVLGEKDSLTEALVTILDNAIKYSPTKSKVVVVVKVTDRHINITVKDKGVGITKDDQEHIFERFYRADSARSKNQADGYGLGLAIAKNVIDLHSGSIEVNSKPGAGSSFTVKLPKH